MATRNPANVERTLSGSTEFQIYVLNIRDGSEDVILDFTEKRLIRCIAAAKETHEKIMLSALLDDYRDGYVAISWHRGQPRFIRMTKER